ncbi:hypothetical protein QBC41DRAFT_349375 [Cercophora samala]|uniref:Uncharacterized protein n=1 Tax=Cercophora samala TaxID=330535 RepID=A0AA40D7G6_9PEZI|nr:hypothetical protein QBC41DRAFT_349375 [Cercophora samala]
MAYNYGQNIWPNSVDQASHSMSLVPYSHSNEVSSNPAQVNHHFSQPLYQQYPTNSAQQHQIEHSNQIIPRPIGMSPNYAGNPYKISNQSAEIEDHLNTCIRGFGKIWATVINSPDINKGHTHAAAKVTFFDAEPAQRFLACYGEESEEGGWRVGGHLVRVRPNRIKVAPSDKPADHSRVLVISGPGHAVNWQTLRRVFEGEGISYQIDEVIPRPHRVEGWATLEVRFGSYRAQASQVYMVVKRKLRQFGIGVRFGLDPCEREE